MSRGHFSLLKRCSPLGAAEGPPRLRSPTGTRQTRQCLRYSFQTGVRRYEYHANPALGATSPRDVVLAVFNMPIVGQQAGRVGHRGELDQQTFVASGLRRSGTKAARAKPAVSPRPESQGALILALIGRSQGATLGEIRKTTGWLAHSVRGFLSTAAKKHSLQIESGKTEAGDRVYRIQK